MKDLIQGIRGSFYDSLHEGHTMCASKLASVLDTCDDRRMTCSNTIKFFLMMTHQITVSF